MIACPVVVSPVKQMRSTPGWRDSGAPAVSPKPWTTLNTPGGTPASSSTVAEQRRSQGRPLRGLEHHGVAGAERRCDPPRRQHQGRVPRHDQPGDAHRLANRVVEKLVADLERPAVQLGHDAGVVLEVLGRPRRQPFHLGDRHADVRDLASNELLGVVADRLRDQAQHRRTLGRLHPGPWPFVERTACRRDCRVDVLCAAVGGEREHIVGRRIQRLEGRTRDAPPEASVDVVLLHPEIRRCGNGRWCGLGQRSVSTIEDRRSYLMWLDSKLQSGHDRPGRSDDGGAGLVFVAWLDPDGADAGFRLLARHGDGRGDSGCA